MPPGLVRQCDQELSCAVYRPRWLDTPMKTSTAAQRQKPVQINRASVYFDAYRGDSNDKKRAY